MVHSKSLFYSLFLGTIIVVCSGCGPFDVADMLSQKNVKSYRFDSNSNTDFTLPITGRFSGYNIYLTVPNDSNMTALIASFDIDGYAMFVEGQHQTSGKSQLDFTSDVLYSLYSYDGNSRNYQVSVVKSEAFFSEFNFNASHNIAIGSEVTGDIQGNGVWFYLPHTISLKKLCPTFSTNQGGPVSYEGTTIESGLGSYDFSSPRPSASMRLQPQQIMTSWIIRSQPTA